MSVLPPDASRPPSGPPDPRRRRYLGIVLVTLAVSLAATAVGFALRAHQATPRTELVTSQQASEPRAPASPRPSPPRFITFDLPDPFAGPPGQGAPRLTGIAIGLFGAAASTPLWSTSVTLDRLERLPDGGARVSLPPSGLPGGVDLVVRLRTLSTNGNSDWSAPSESFVLEAPVVDPSAIGRRTRSRTETPRPPTRSTRARTRSRTVALADIQSRPVLLGAFERARGSMSADAAVSGLRSVEELATVITLASHLGVSYADIHAAVVGPPRRSMRQAVRMVRPTGDPRASVRRATSEAQALLVRQ